MATWKNKIGALICVQNLFKSLRLRSPSNLKIEIETPRSQRLCVMFWFGFHCNAAAAAHLRRIHEESFPCAKKGRVLSRFWSVWDDFEAGMKRKEGAIVMTCGNRRGDCLFRIFFGWERWWFFSGLGRRKHCWRNCCVAFTVDECYESWWILIRCTKFHPRHQSCVCQ